MSTSTSTSTSKSQSSSPTSTSLSPTGPATHTIRVGPKEDPHQYVPNSILAEIGDLVVFEFYPRNHSVVQADWNAPCVPADGDYFFSGIKNEFQEVNGQVVGALLTWNWTVDSKEPIFFYCTGLESCLVNGMVGAINPNATQTWQSQHDAALKFPYMLLPGQPMPAEGDQSPNTTTPHSSDTSSSSSSSSSSSLSPGAIAGIAIGAIAFALLVGVLLFLLGRNRVYRKWITSQCQDGSSSANAANAMRTARWALFNSASGAGPGEGSSTAGTGTGTGTGTGGGAGSEVGTGGTGTGTGAEAGASPVRNSSFAGPGTGTGIGSGFLSLPPEYNTYPHSQGQGYGYAYGQGHGTEGFGSPLQVPVYGSPSPPPPQQQQPYWIWDQNVQPKGRAGGGPSELEGSFH